MKKFIRSVWTRVSLCTSRMKNNNKLNIVKALFTLFLLSGSLLIAQSEWCEDSFDAFRDGTFQDAGSNSYVSAKGRVQMITRWDFNNDGNLDVFIPSSQSHTEKENIYIYLNNGRDIDARSRIELPAAGAIDGLLADFNKDGYNDLAVIHYSDSYFKRVPVWIYLGSEKGYSITNRVELPSAGGTAIARGDFNNDSWIDVALACQYWEDSEDINIEPRKSIIYWNSEEGFDPLNRLEITFNRKGILNLAVGDLDNDNKDDLVGISSNNTYLFLSSRNAFEYLENVISINLRSLAASIGDVNNDKFSDLALCTSEGIMIYKAIYNNVLNLNNSVLLHVSKATDVVLSDVNKDDFDDVIVANFSTKGGATWTDSPVFYSNGKDFTKKNSVELPTLGAKSLRCYDLNGDSYPEIIFSFFQITNQKSFLSYIYWNNEGTYRFENHSQLPTLGTMANAAGDVNSDGLPDVVFFNDEGGFRDGPLEFPIYWGDGTRNFNPVRKYVFQTHQVFGFGHADLNDDNNVDMILCQQNFVSGVQHDQGGLIIYWGDNGEFNPPTYLTMKFGYGGVRISDIDKDGYLDLIAGGYCIDLNEPEKHGFPIFWGSKQGFSFKNRTVLHYSGSKFRVPLLMDLNKDNYLDIAGQVEDGKVRIWWGAADGFSDGLLSDIDLGRKDHLMYIKGADFNNDGWLDLLFPQRLSPHGTQPSSFIYYGSDTGYVNSSREEIYSFVPYQNSIADLNKDGWLDIFLTSYGCEPKGNHASLIYLGSRNGFKNGAIELESYGSSGSEVLDYDNDGWLDILICNHRQAYSHLLAKPHVHKNPSLLYWGSEKGFSKENRVEFPAIGPSGLNPRDAGNSYNRGLYEDYISSVYSIKESEILSSIKWIAKKPFGTDVKFQVRTADNKNNLQLSEWLGPDGSDSWYKESGSKLTGYKGKYIQYRARLITPNGAATPYLTSVTISFEKE
ncbi:FG-GAP repeat domain-containing protein [Bacteroidota bacterium]